MAEGTLPYPEYLPVTGEIPFAEKGGGRVLV